MKKWLSSMMILGIILSFVGFITPASADIITKDLPDIKAGSYVIYDADTSEVLFGKKYTDVEQPAEMAQIMTALIALEKGNLSDKVVIPKLPKDTEYANRLYLDEGEEIPLENLIEGSIVYNASDASYSIANHIGKTQEAFIAMMNDKAKEIGLSDTVFRSSYGYNKEQKTTTLDMAKLASYAMKNEAYIKYANKTSMAWTSNLLSKDNIPNVNGFKKLLPEAIGLKYSDAQNGTFGFISAVTLENRNIVGVILDSSNRDGLADAMSVLMQLGVDGTKRQRVIAKNEVLSTLDFGEGKVVTAQAAEDFFKTIATNGSSDLIYKTTFTKSTLPIEKGEKIGVASVYTGKEKIADIDLVAGETVKNMTSSLIKAGLLILTIIVAVILFMLYQKRQAKKRRMAQAKRKSKKGKKSTKKLPKRTEQKALMPSKEEMKALLKNPSLGSEAGRKKLEAKVSKKGRH